ASAYLYRGIVYEKRGDLARAAQDFAAAASLAPHDLAARYDLALTAAKLGEKKDALKLYSELRRKDYPAAWAALERAAQINNADFDVLANQILFAACLKAPQENAKSKAKAKRRRQ
ncbi:MAG: tetratricopeptide repeat protein, partial [Selenomonas sp.]|nr:tetratricopeptide repeat protein [Selenomonas sp.]